MPALVERTKIKKEYGSTPTSEDLGYIGSRNTWITNPDPLFPISANPFDWVVASTRFVGQPYLHLPSPNAADFINKIYNYKNLSDNWDNNGAVAPTGDLIKKAALFIQSTDESDLPVYFIAPGPNGEIVVEYKNGNCTAEVFFNEDGTEEMLLYSGKLQLHAGNLNFKLLIQHLS